MPFPPEAIANILESRSKVAADLQSLQLDLYRKYHNLETGHVREYIFHGVSRRLSVIARSVENIFELFPINTEHKISKEAIGDVQINLHALLINIVGVFDNLAWAFVHKHNLLDEIGGKFNVDIFKKNLQKCMPLKLREHVNSEVTVRWYNEYLKNYRDALAHRIPPYIPPANFTTQDGVRYNELEKEHLDCIMQRNWTRLEEVVAEQQAIGIPCMYFLHSLTDELRQSPVYIHPQILCDAMTVVEFGKLFIEQWHERA